MDNDFLRTISDQLYEANKKLEAIKALLMIIAMFAFLAGRAAVLEHGFWKIVGF